MTGGIVISALYALLAAAALQDMWKLRISNAFPVLIIALYPVWLAVMGVDGSIWQNVVLFALALTIGAFLFARHWFGGGDVKLFAAAALWFDLSGGLALVAYVTIGGGLLSLIFIVLRRLTPALVRDHSGWAALKTRGPIPYGMAIACGAILCAQLHGVNPNGKAALAAHMQSYRY